MASFRLFVKEFLTSDDEHRLRMPRSFHKGGGYYEFSNVNALEPTMWLPIEGFEAIRDMVTKVTVILDDAWVGQQDAYRQDAARYYLGAANCIVEREAQHIGGIHAHIIHTSKLHVSGPTLQSVLELIFAMKQGVAEKVDDMSFADYAKQRGIPYSALRKSWKQRLQDWWDRTKQRFCEWKKRYKLDTIGDI